MARVTTHGRSIYLRSHPPNFWHGPRFYKRREYRVWCWLWFIVLWKKR